MFQGREFGVAYPVTQAVGCPMHGETTARFQLGKRLFRQRFMRLSATVLRSGDGAARNVQRHRQIGVRTLRQPGQQAVFAHPGRPHHVDQALAHARPNAKRWAS